MLLDMLRSGADRGVRYVDLGKGMSLYKRRLMTGAVPVATGTAVAPALLNRVIDMRRRVEAFGVACVEH